MPTDDTTWLALAYTQAARSIDPRTQNGAILVKDDALLAVSWNKFPAGIENRPERWNDREAKWRYVAHAEESVCITGLRIHGSRVVNSTLYCPWYACTECAKAIIQSGIARIVGHTAVRRFAEQASPDWTLSTRHALEMLDESGVTCDWVDGAVPGAPSVRIGGQLFDPTI